MRLPRLPAAFTSLACQSRAVVEMRSDGSRRMEYVCVVISPSYAEWINNNTRESSHHGIFTPAGYAIVTKFHSTSVSCGPVVKARYFTLAHPSNPRRPGDMQLCGRPDRYAMLSEGSDVDAVMSQDGCWVFGVAAVPVVSRGSGLSMHALSPWQYIDIRCITNAVQFALSICSYVLHMLLLSCET